MIACARCGAICVSRRAMPRPIAVIAMNVPPRKIPARTIVAWPGEITLSALSAHLGMLPGNVHRYLASLQFEGFVKQERVSGEYDLGPAALALGTRAMRRLDNQEVAFQETRALSKEIDASVWLSVWTENIPVVVAVHDRGAIGPLTARLGTRVRATYSAQGRVFLAYREQALTDAMWKIEYDKDEPPRSEGQVLDLPKFQKLLATIRERGGKVTREAGPMKGGSTVIAFVEDPDGYKIELIQRK